LVHFCYGISTFHGLLKGRYRKDKIISDKKAVWLITEYYYPNENTTSYLLGLIAEGLSGYTNVNVITSTQGDKKIEINNSVKIFRARNSSFDKNILHLRIIKHIISGAFLFIRSIRLIKKGDEVFVVTDPATSVFFIRLLKLFKSFRLTFMIHDLFPENLITIKAIKENNIFYKIIRLIYNWAFKGADRLFVIGRDMEKVIKKKLKNHCPPIFLVPNFADINEIIPMPKNENAIIKKYQLENKFILLFTGTIGRLQGINNLLESMLLLKDEKVFHLIMIGDGAYKKMVEEFLKTHELSNVTLIDTMERKYSNDFLNAGDLGIVSLIKNCSGTAVPSKTYTYMAAGKPILAIMDKNAEISILIEQTNIGWRVDPDNPKIFVKKLREIYKSSDDLNLKGENSRKICCEYYSVEKAISNILSAINQ
jgi:glycosyltransferase involved in cell wall biosynthesis